MSAYAIDAGSASAATVIPASASVRSRVRSYPCSEATSGTYRGLSGGLCADRNGFRPLVGDPERLQRHRRRALGDRLRVRVRCDPRRVVRPVLSHVDPRARPSLPTTAEAATRWC